MEDVEPVIGISGYLGRFDAIAEILFVFIWIKMKGIINNMNIRYE
jgi:hypothetical protein